jgi:hypothetical protein
VKAAFWVDSGELRRTARKAAGLDRRTEAIVQMESVQKRGEEKDCAVERKNAQAQGERGCRLKKRLLESTQAFPIPKKKLKPSSELYGRFNEFLTGSAWAPSYTAAAQIH